jgi:hypothetical protein
MPPSDRSISTALRPAPHGWLNSPYHLHRLHHLRSPVCVRNWQTRMRTFAVSVYRRFYSDSVNSAPASASAPGSSNHRGNGSSVHRPAMLHVPVGLAARCRENVSEIRSNVSTILPSRAAFAAIAESESRIKSAASACRRSAGSQTVFEPPAATDDYPNQRCAANQRPASNHS